MEDLEMTSTFWSNKKVLVTGHSGFKGSWLSLWLTQLGASVSGLSLPEPVSTPDLFSILRLKDSLHDLRGDIGEPEVCMETLQSTSPEILLHLAAQPLVRESYQDPVTTYRSNVMGTLNLLEAARSVDSLRVIVVITTDKCYENLEKNYAYVETDPLGGYDPYSSSKACAELLASSYYRSFFREAGLGLATARAGNVIGGGDWALDRLIPDAVRAWSRNEI